MIINSGASPWMFPKMCMGGPLGANAEVRFKIDAVMVIGFAKTGPIGIGWEGATVCQPAEKWLCNDANISTTLVDHFG